MPVINPTKAQLQEAQAAYHQLLLGTAPRVVVDQNNERVEFHAANKGALYTYIMELQQALSVGCGGVALPSSAFHPATFTF